MLMLLIWLQKYTLFLNKTSFLHHFLHYYSSITVNKPADAYTFNGSGQFKTIQTVVFCADELTCYIRRHFQYLIYNLLLLLITTAITVLIEVFDVEIKVLSTLLLPMVGIFIR